jgi:hypothetical protein
MHDDPYLAKRHDEELMGRPGIALLLSLRMARLRATAKRSGRA